MQMLEDLRTGVPTLGAGGAAGGREAARIAIDTELFPFLPSCKAVPYSFAESLV